MPSPSLVVPVSANLLYMGGMGVTDLLKWLILSTMCNGAAVTLVDIVYEIRGRQIWHHNLGRVRLKSGRRSLGANVARHDSIVLHANAVTDSIILSYVLRIFQRPNVKEWSREIVNLNRSLDDLFDAYITSRIRFPTPNECICT